MTSDTLSEALTEPTASSEMRTIENNNIVLLNFKFIPPLKKKKDEIKFYFILQTLESILRLIYLFC